MLKVFLVLILTVSRGDEKSVIERKPSHLQIVEIFNEASQITAPEVTDKRESQDGGFQPPAVPAAPNIPEPPAF